MISNKKILITGGAGFIGSHLVEALVGLGNEVVVLDNLLRGNKIVSDVFKKITFIKADVNDFNQVLEASIGCDMIFHFAAILGVDIVADNPMETMETEVIGTQNVVRAALQNNISKIIYASTSGVYGHNALEQTVTEEILVDPTTSYAMAKRYNEIYLASLQEEKGIDCICLRFFNVYGPRQDSRMVVPRFIEQAKAGRSITVYGSGKQTRDFTYIDDTINATIKLASNVTGFEIFNVANELESDIATLAEKIRVFTESKSEITLINAPAKRYDYEVGRRVGSSDKLMRFTGFKPTTSLDDGIKSILEYAR